MVKNPNYDVNYKLRQMISSTQGGISMADLSDILQRIAALEENKQDKITAGQGILISGNNIAAQNIIDDTRNSATTVWSSSKVKSLVESFEGGVNVVITSSRPSELEGIEKTMYYVGDSSPYHIWFFLDNNYIDFGTTEISLENYYTKLEIDNLLELKVDKEEGKVLISLEDLAQITKNKNDIVVLDGSKVDKEEGKTLISSEDLSQISLNKVNISNLSNQKVDKVSGKSLVSNVSISQITTNKNDIADLKNGVSTNQNDISNLTSTKQDKITDSTLSSISDFTTISSVSASAKTSKSFTLSKLWDYIKNKISNTTSDTYDSVTDDDLFSQNGAYDLWDNATKASNNNTESASDNLLINLYPDFSLVNTTVLRFADNLYYIHLEIKTASEITPVETTLVRGVDDFKINDKNIYEGTFSACARGDTSPMGCTWNGGRFFIYPVNTVTANSTMKIAGIVRTSL